MTSGLCPDFAIFGNAEQYVSKSISTGINISQEAENGNDY